MTHWEFVAGLEVHVQLRTRTKMFCRCPAVYGEPPNTLVCPTCLGLPGSLPIVNREALAMAMKTALALGGTVARSTRFDRKNYFYPDLPKNYQITQYDQPVAEGGRVAIEGPGGAAGGGKDIRLVRVHLEEDAGKLVHGSRGTLIDLNRAGTPLLEIVTHPDFSSPDEAYAFLVELKSILEYIEVSDCNMEEGSLRCDANVSVRPAGAQTLGTKTEIKNMNSFKAVRAALAHEAARHVRTLEEGNQVVQETRLWQEERLATLAMRTKEEAEDYRYFPEPDLPPAVFSDLEIETCREKIGELPRARRARYVDSLGLSPYDVGVLTSRKSLADFFERLHARTGDAKSSANWVTNQVLSYLNEHSSQVRDFPIDPERLAELVLLAREGVVSSRMAGKVYEAMLGSSKRPGQIVEELGGGQIRDPDQILSLCREVVAASPEAAAAVRAGKAKAMDALVGQVMKKTRGRADPALTVRLLEETLREPIP